MGDESTSGPPGVAPGAEPRADELTPEDQELAEDITAGIDRRLRRLGLATPGRRDNVSFVIDCRSRLKERRWDVRRQRHVCAALERRYLLAGWKYASIYVMEHDHLRLRVTLRAVPATR